MTPARARALARPLDGRLPRGERVGAAVYDAAHTYALPILLGLAGVLADAEVAKTLALIWLAHIGADRAIGYGLKYPTDFNETHLQRV